jgi:hypothetical protein
MTTAATSSAASAAPTIRRAQKPLRFPLMATSA